METSFEHLIETHRQALERAALKFCHGDFDLAQDMVQDTFVKALRNAERFSTGTNLGDGSATNVVNLNGGALSFTGAGAQSLGANRVVIIGASNGTLNASSATGVLTIDAGISASSTGNLIKTGPGSVIVSGTTNLNGGLGTVTVNDGKLTASFGTGGISAVTVASAGNLSFQEGNAVALTLTGGITITGGGRLGFDLGAAGGPGASDQLNSAIAAITGGTITLDFAPLGGFGVGSYNLISASSGLSGASYPPAACHRSGGWAPA